MSSRKQNNARRLVKRSFGASFSESVKFFDENSFTQETDFFSEWENYWFGLRLEY